MADRKATVSVEAIRVLGRHRKDLGDIDELAASIRAIGKLINPITITADNRLLAGERRLAAVRQLGWTEIDVRIIDTLDDAVARLTIERDENTCRKAMTVEELIALGAELEELARVEAKERQRAAGREHGRGIASAQSSGSYRRDHSKEVTSIVARTLGMGAATYKRAKHVVEAARDEQHPAHAEAVRALDAMNATGRVEGSYKRVRQAERASSTGSNPAPAPETEPPTPAPLHHQTRKRIIREQAENLDRMSTQMVGIRMAIDSMVAQDFPMLDPDATKVARCMGDLRETRRAIGTLLKHLEATS